MSYQTRDQNEFEKNIQIFAGDAHGVKPCYARCNALHEDVNS